MKTTNFLIIFSSLSLCIACQKQTANLTDEETKAIIDSTTYIAKVLLDAQNKDPKFSPSTVSLFKHYFSHDKDIRHIQHGNLFTSVDSMFARTESNAAFSETIEYIELKPDRYDAVVLSRDAVSITIPNQWKMKVKGRPEYAGKEVLSMLFQKRNGRWLIIQSHISDPNICEAMAALMPLPNDKSN